LEDAAPELKKKKRNHSTDVRIEDGGGKTTLLLCAREETTRALEGEGEGLKGWRLINKRTGMIKF